MDMRITNLTFTGKVVGKVLPSEGETQIRIITLNNGEHLRSTLYNVEKGWIIVFRLGPNLYGKEIRIFTNHPASPKEQFDRNNYRQLKWYNNDTPDKVDQQYNYRDVVKCFVQLPIIRAGCFNYYFAELKGKALKTLGSGYFTVNPVLSVGSNEEKLLLIDSIQCQTVLTKCLGLFEEWPNRLVVSKESGYNAIHFTPVQELGSSNSSYSIKDQFKLNPKIFPSDITFTDVSKFMESLREDWGTLCIGDVVLNHTSDESPWLQEHPECTYNMVTAPHLVPAAILDGYFQVFSKKVAEGAYVQRGIPRRITNEGHLRAIRWFLEGDFKALVRLEDFFTCNVDKIVNEFQILVRSTEPVIQGLANLENVVLKMEPSLGRKQATVDMELVLKTFNRKGASHTPEEIRIRNCMRNLRRVLELRNATATRVAEDHFRIAVDNCIATIRYQRVLPEGLQLRELSSKYPLIPRYFTGYFNEYHNVDEQIFTRGEFVMALNGWVMNYDPLVNFAGRDSDVYLRRELVVWGDLVKLRYGESPNDCPFLWKHMRKYVEACAKMFQGFRLDNCHSTSLAVGEYMMDCARKIRPDLYIVAELFTESDDIDCMYMNRLGITSIVREEMRAWNTDELTRLIYRYGGQPVGSFYNSSVQLLVPSNARSMFFDVTHDNDSQIEKRSVFNCLPCAALVSMACCATGSTRGFDELVPHKVDVVEENRTYKTWGKGGFHAPNEVTSNCGIIAVKKELNMLHKKLNDEGYSEVFIDQIDEDIITVTRHNPATHDSVILITFVSYTHPEDISVFGDSKMLKLEGDIDTILLEASLNNFGEWGYFCKPKYFAKDPDYVNGLWEFTAKLRSDIKVEQSSFLCPRTSDDPNFSEYVLRYFFPGTIIVAKVIPKPHIRPKMDFMISFAETLLNRNCRSLIDISLKLNLEDLNFILFMCSEEGLEAGCGCYHIPGFGSLVYCGLQGFSSILLEVRKRNDLGHPFFQNLRHGDWMMDYITRRLKTRRNTLKLGEWFGRHFGILKQLPRFLIPRYFDLIVNAVTDLLHLSAVFQMGEFVKYGSSFIGYLALGSVQCIGDVNCNTLPPFSPAVKFAYPKLKDMTLCAGLPHFAAGYMRSWGRDTFISLRGLMLLTERFEVARAHILGYASCLRHGLIPNLLDSGINPRYNSRDAVWWWLYSITCYVKLASDGFKILEDSVSRLFPSDDSPRLRAGLVDQPLYRVMHEALSVHFQGLSFRERNAGPQIDAHMMDEGFNVTIGVDLATGFVYGGNEHNCGTWMDKMGTSVEAGNYGQPATPRDGSAVELVGLCKRVVDDLADFYDKGYYPFDSVSRTTEEGETIKWTFREWGDKIAENFEKHFWIDKEARPGDNDLLIHRRGIYKDSVGATYPWTDYQLRCNFLITLTLAPELVSPERAWSAIEKAEEVLLGPLGIRTLDPADWAYNGDYHAHNDSNNPKVAHGFNYHQGPEWIWPVGYFLRAKLHFAKLRGSTELNKSISKIWSHLGNLYENLLVTQWKSLPELTNSYGSHCAASCNVQAWSMACILEALYDLHKLEDSYLTDNGDQTH